MLEIFESSDPRAAARIERLKLRFEALASGPGSAASRARTAEIFGEELAPAEAVRRIVAAVRDGGDEGLFEYARKLDGFELTPENVRVTDDEIAAAKKSTDPGLMEAIRAAAANIRAYQARLLPQDLALEGEHGLETGAKYTPVERAGVLVPAGTAPLPSSLLMGAVPAQVAGVGEIAVVTPPKPDGSVDPTTLAAAAEIGLSEVYRVGGVQAVAALACGTDSVKKVDKIVGPGNIFVTLAKREVYGVVDIDLFAGPSEILVIADDTASAEFVAADLLGQAEHDALASAVLVTTSGEFAAKVRKEVEEQLSGLERREIARRSIDEYGLAVVCGDLDGCCELANAVAPEHLELIVADPEALVPRIRNAGAVFIGEWTPEAVGDYLAGPSHTLPTGGTARFFSGLSAASFLKRTSLVRSSAEWLRAEGAKIMRLASAEGLDAHAVSVRRRLQK